MAAAAEAPGSGENADQIADTINAVAPAPPSGSGALVRPDTTSPGSSGGAIKATGDDLAVSIPTDASGVVSLTRPDGSATGVKVSLPSAAPSKAVVASNGTVTYDNALPATDLAVQAFDHGVRIQTVLSGDASPTEFTYPVDVPSGGSMSLSPDGGVLIVAPDGSPAGGFAAPWAKDASGATVATSYEIRGNSVVQHVDHSGRNYPIVADPWLWIDLISSASWSYHPEGWTLMVAPTGWARAQAGSYAVGVADWDELYSKYRNNGLNTNLPGMRDQLICHQQIVALRAPRKPTWNLDEWRPNVGYWQTVNSSCNPGGSRWFD